MLKFIINNKSRERLISLICKFPPKLKRRLLLKLEGKDVWIHGGGKLGTAIECAIDHFVSDDLKKDKDFLNTIIEDIYKCFIEYDILPVEYFYFEFLGKSDRDRREYLTDAEEDSALVKKIGYEKYINDLSNKWFFYQSARHFFHREVMLFDENTQRVCFVDYCLNLKELFIKPLTGSEGNGAFSASIVDPQSAEHLYDVLSESEFRWMVEERIEQTAEMGKWNSSSVNTVRLPSFLNRRGFFVLAPIFRTGRKGKDIDNTSAGGVFALIDARVGVISSNGFDIDNNVYVTHPDSGLRFKDYQIPRWHELLSIAHKVHQLFPTHIYIAWDFALTDKGWVLVEGNWGRFRGAQIAGRKGIKTEFFKYLNG